MSPIANYTTQVSADKSASEIEVMLKAHHARGVYKEYDAAGNLAALSFVVPTKQGDLPFQLPANAAAVKRVLERQAVRAFIDDARAQRVAWRILRDWVRAQMAIIETDMVSVDQVFMPYILLKDKTTLYHALTSGRLQLPQQGSPDK
jgi:hypothetical protein